MVKSEIYKLFKYKAFWIVFLLQIGLSTLLTFIDTPKTLSAALTSLDVTASFFLVFVLMFSSSLLMYYAEHEAQPQIFENAFSGLSGVSGSS